MTTEETIAKRAVLPPHFLPAADVLAGETADVYFERARRILAAEGLDPVVTMEIFAREEAVLCGAEEALAYLRAILGGSTREAADPTPVVESLHDGDVIAPKEVVMRIAARYSAFTRPRSSASSRRAPAGRRQHDGSLRRPTRSRSSASVRGTCTPASPIRWTTPRWWVAASGPRPPPAPDWRASPRPGRCRTP
jgi:hypothetical protein